MIDTGVRLLAVVSICRAAGRARHRTLGTCFAGESCSSSLLLLLLLTPTASAPLATARLTTLLRRAAAAVARAR